jgi:Domain of unknown function (DUF4337)
MSEEPIETHELREQLEEAKEHAEHGEHAGQRWTLYLSLSTAIIAVFAAVTALQSSANESHALLEKNEAILAQAKASDQWAYFQAKGTKAVVYEAQAEVASPEVAARFREARTRYKQEQDEIEKEARALELEVKRHDEAGEEYFHHHHRFALAVTIFQVSIALAAIAALTKRRPLWYVSMLVGASGFVFFLLWIGFFGG